MDFALLTKTDDTGLHLTVQRCGLMDEWGYTLNERVYGADRTVTGHVQHDATIDGPAELVALCLADARGKA